jgi:hypothetical protein
MINIHPTKEKHVGGKKKKKKKFAIQPFTPLYSFLSVMGGEFADDVDEGEE